MRHRKCSPAYHGSEVDVDLVWVPFDQPIDKLVKRHLVRSFHINIQKLISKACPIALANPVELGPKSRYNAVERVPHYYKLERRRLGVEEIGGGGLLFDVFVDWKAHVNVESEGEAVLWKGPGHVPLGEVVVDLIGYGGGQVLSANHLQPRRTRGFL